MQGNLVTAERKRAAIELVAREETELRKTARRFSLCEDDAEDAYQRALEILLLKAPNERPRDLIRWTKTVVKHEALAIRHYRERMLGVGSDGVGDPVERIAASSAGPEERTERREEIARSREALRALKPAELQSLTLLAAGYSYAEIGEATGFSHTKVNRSIAEGRERVRRLLSHSEDGTRCEELRPFLSAYCDGELDSAGRETVREHLRACSSCRATMRSYRSTPAAVAALAPVLPASRSLLERAHELLANLHSRLPGGGGEKVGLTQIAAAGGTPSAGMTALAKVLAICAGTVGGAVCVVTGVAPVPLLESDHSTGARVERVAQRAVEENPAPKTVVETPPHREAQPKPKPEPKAEPDPEPATPPVEEAEAAAEYVAPPPEPAPVEPAAEPSSTSSGSAAGEFGP